MRGLIDLSRHKLANVFRAPAQRSHWYRTRPPKKGVPEYRSIYRIVDGAVRDAFANHPEYLTPVGRRFATASVSKRVTGALYGYVTEVTRGRSEATDRTTVEAAADRSDEAVPSRFKRLAVLGLRGAWRLLETVAQNLSKDLS